MMSKLNGSVIHSLPAIKFCTLYAVHLKEIKLTCEQRASNIMSNVILSNNLKYIWLVN